MQHEGYDYLLNTADAARRLCVSERTVKALLARRELEVVRIGRRRLIVPESISAFIARQRALQKAS